MYQYGSDFITKSGQILCCEAVIAGFKVGKENRFFFHVAENNPTGMD